MKTKLNCRAADRTLAQKIEAIHKKYPTYGYRRVKELLKQEGEKVNHKRVRRVMTEFNLYAHTPRAFRNTTQSRHAHARYRNELEGQEIKRTNQAWGSDITYIRNRGRFYYLAIILDLYSRKVIGWSIGPAINQELTLSALMNAIKQRSPEAGCIHHSDQGVQYCAESYIEALKEHNFIISMSRAGNPYDNSIVERFMKTLKYEEVYMKTYNDFEDLVRNVADFIETYNKERLHSSLGYLSPIKYENKNRANYRIGV
jgi:putative transposase